MNSQLRYALLIGICEENPPEPARTADRPMR